MLPLPPYPFPPLLALRLSFPLSIVTCVGSPSSPVSQQPPRPRLRLLAPPCPPPPRSVFRSSSPGQRHRRSSRLDPLFLAPPAPCPSASAPCPPTVSTDRRDRDLSPSIRLFTGEAFLALVEKAESVCRWAFDFVVASFGVKFQPRPPHPRPLLSTKHRQQQKKQSAAPRSTTARSSSTPSTPSSSTATVREVFFFFRREREVIFFFAASLFLRSSLFSPRKKNTHKNKNF